MSETVRTYGTLNAYTLTLFRTPIAPAPTSGPPTSRLALCLVNGADQRFIADFPDLPEGGRPAAQCATAILTASVALGLNVAFGG